MALHPPVECPAAHAEFAGRPAHIAPVPLERTADEITVRLVECHPLEAGGRLAFPVKRQVACPDPGSRGEENGPLDRVPELPHIARPAVPRQLPERLAVESLDLPPVPAALPLEEVAREKGDVLGPFPKGRKPDLDRVQPLEEV